MEIITIILAVAGLGVGYGASTVISKKKSGSAEEAGKKELAKAKKEADKIVEEAKTKAQEIAEEARRSEQDRRKEVKSLENRLLQREESIDKKLEDLDKRSEKLRKNESELDQLKNDIKDIRVRQQDKLEKIAKLGKAEAAEKLMAMTERDIKEDLVGLVVKLQNEAKEEAEDQAAVIITSAMERMSSEVTAERTETTLKLGNEGSYYW